MAASRAQTAGCMLLVLALGSSAGAGPSAARKPEGLRYESPVVHAGTPGHAVDIDADISGARELYLVVTDGGNGYACDWADWVEPRLVGPNGELRLTELKWTSASAAWGRVQVGRNAGGGPLRVGGCDVAYGIGTHAFSVIHYKIPEGYTRFRARGGLDAGGVEQGGCGRNASVRFYVFTAKPPARFLRASGADDGSHEPARAVESLDLYPGLEATLFASEPMTLSLTNLDVDHRGRVWVCEVVNYRRHNGRRPEGDRILILEDEDGDGRADTSKVFYQGRDIDSAMGICVLGEKVIVSASPNIFVFYDEDGDDRPERKEVLFTKTGQPQHDHSAHSFIFGPDGKLYWNFGNTGRAVHDRDGKVVVDLAGNPVADNGRPYFGGMVFRMNPDGSEFEVLAHNFRNNYEVAVDSFGTLWQSDNDDDGNRGVRINYVMEFGNFGYRDEITGAGWRTPRIGMHPDIPTRHWHQNDPGVVPNLLQTGAGSPAGITVYEGGLLPEVFRNQVIHCDAGPNVVRAYPVEPDGAGYRARIVNIAVGARDRWFRPADVCVAPDGSIFVTDWYDPGVGGHNMRDLDRGRVFRIAPKGSRYKVPRFDFSTAEGAAKALANPNLAVRYLAWRALENAGDDAERALGGLLRSKNPRLRARALWFLGKHDRDGRRWVEEALRDANPDLRITGIRLARQLHLGMRPLVRRLLDDPSPAVRRDCAIALRFDGSREAAELWAELALKHDGRDRWYLEALGIGADLKWDACFAAWLARAGERWRDRAGRDIVWRSRAKATSQYLARLLLDSAVPEEEVPRLLRAFHFQPATARDEALLGLLRHAGSIPEARRETVKREAIRYLGESKAPERAAILARYVGELRGSDDYVELVVDLHLADHYGDLVALAAAHPREELGIRAVRGLLRLGDPGRKAIERALRTGSDGDGLERLALVDALGAAADGRAAPILLGLMDDGAQPLELKRRAAASLAKLRNGAAELLRRAREGKLPEALRDACAFPLRSAPWREIRAEAEKLFPAPPQAAGKPLPPLTALVGRRGDPRRGAEIFAGKGTCSKCHKARGVGKEVGPDLSEIGSKLSREALFESILYPSAGISHGYESYAFVLKDGNVLVGVVKNETPEEVTVVGSDAIERAIRKADILRREREETSLMPQDLVKELEVGELVDLVEFLASLEKKEP